MDVFEAMKTRRSIRKYSDQAVPDEAIERMLRAAMMAPSAGNAQPWQFVVVRDRSKLEKVKDYNPYAAMAEKAPVAVLVCGDLRLEKYQGFWVQDCSAAVQNLLLAVHGMGLGAVWTGIYPMESRVEGFKALFDLPDPVIPLALVVIGYPDQRIPSKDRFKPDRVHQDGWRGGE